MRELWYLMIRVGRHRNKFVPSEKVRLWIWRDENITAHLHSHYFLSCHQDNSHSRSSLRPCPSLTLHPCSPLPLHPPSWLRVNANNWLILIIWTTIQIARAGAASMLAWAFLSGSTPCQHSIPGHSSPAHQVCMLLAPNSHPFSLPSFFLCYTDVAYLHYTIISYLPSLSKYTVSNLCLRRNLTPLFLASLRW